MTMKTITENGRVYQMDDNGMVVDAKLAGEAEAPELEFVVEPLKIGDRVEASGKLGKVATRTLSVYGDSIGIKFDDGSFEEFLAAELERTSEDEIYYDKPIDEVKNDWTQYQDMSEITLEEVDSKAAVARRLNVTAKALVTDSRIPLSDRVELDHIILATGTDLYDFREKAERLNVEDHADYLSSLPKYEMSEEFSSYTSRSNEDISWLIAAADTVADEAGQLDWDQHLMDEALKATAKLTEEQLSSEEFMSAVAEYRDDAMPLGYDAKKRTQFRALLEQARTSALNERSAQYTAKTAAVEEDLNDFDASALYL
jgi:hypothetical protein